MKRILSELQPDEIRKVIDLELSFIFDGVFSKASAVALYQGIGIISRLLYVIFLVVAEIGVIILDTTHSVCMDTTLNTIPFALGLTNLLLLVALLVECMQLVKIMMSNWVRVWLACNYALWASVAHDSLGFTWLRHYSKIIIMFGLRYVGEPRMNPWNFKLEQLSIFIDSLDNVKRHFVLKSNIVRAHDIRKMQQKITSLLDMEMLHGHLINKILKRYEDAEEFQELWQLRMHISKKISPLSRTNSLHGLTSSSSRTSFAHMDLFHDDSGLEDIVLNCHLLTSAFEFDLLDEPEWETIRKDVHVMVSIGLSRYCMHLLIRRPKLTPEDPDIARGLYKAAKEQLKQLFTHNLTQSRDVGRLLQGHEEFGIGKAILLATKMSERMAWQEKWKLLAQIWIDIVIYITISGDNAFSHIEQMAKGGEILTHFWVLLGHLGHKRSSLMGSR